MASVEERVKKIIVEELGVSDEQVKGEAKFIDDLGADSLDQVELVMRFEEEFERSVRDLFIEVLREARFEPTVHFERGPVFVLAALHYWVEREGTPPPDPDPGFELVSD